MKKHALMLTAATVALMTGQAFAAGPTTITTKVTTQQKTSSTGDITIGTTSGTTTTPGSVVVTVAGPAIEIDSKNYLNSTLAGNLIGNTGTTGAIGVQMDAMTTPNGPGTAGCVSSACGFALINSGTIDLTGSGTGKTGILVGLSPATLTAGTFNGGIDLVSGSTLKVQGDSSTGIEIASGAVMNGDLTIAGAVTVTSSTTTSATATAVTGVGAFGTINGDFDIASGGSVTAVGQGAQGVVLLGPLNGSFTNSGALQALGTSGTLLTTATTGNPEAGSALIIANNVTGGIYNGGPTNTGDTTARAAIVSTGPGPAIVINPAGAGATTTTGVGISLMTDPAGSLGSLYSFINRGTVGTKPADPDIGSTGITLLGSSTANAVTFSGGIFNSGAITSAATTDTKATTATGATALNIGQYVTVPTLVNDFTESHSGQISATVSGTNSASATAISIGQYASLPQIVNSGSILASVSTTDTTVASQTAYAIRDFSGTLTTINNTGTIAASATILDNNTQVTVAADLSANTTGVTFTNTGTVSGDILLGSNNDKVYVNQLSAAASSSITGNISFNGGQDTLYIGDKGTVTGALTERGGGAVGVTVGNGSGTGTLTLTNTTAGLGVGTFQVNDGGTLNLSVSQAFNTTNASYVGPLISANSTGSITLSSGSNFNLSFGSFISTPGGTGTAQFVLLDAPVTKLTVSNYAAIKTALQPNIPYLFTGGLCGYHTATVTDACSASSTTTDSQLILELSPKTIGTGTNQIPLTGNTAKIFPYANAALANDNPLGGAIVTNVTDATKAQAAYASFLPDLSGSTRAVAVSLTDQATGPVGARQRALRMYAAQPGSATLWGQEFAQRDASGGNTDAYRANGWGFALGVDGGDPRNGRYGGALTFFSGDQTNKGPNFTRTSNEWYMLTGYTDWRGKGLFLDTQMSFGYGSLTGKRYLQLTDTSSNVVFSRTAAGKRAGMLLAAGVSTGAVLTYGNTAITPQFSLDGLTMREEGYTETGGGNPTGGDGFDLKVNPYYANSLRGYVGTAVRQDLDIGDFYIQPEVRVGYRYDFIANPVQLKAAFASMAGTTGSQFSLTGPDPARGDLVGGLSLAVTTGAWSLGVAYDYLKGSGNGVSQSGMVTLVGRI